MSSENMKNMLQTISYHFSQSFPVSAQKAYQWSTDFTPQDHSLMGEVNAERQVIHLSDGVLVLKEIFHSSSGNIEKQKLVHIYPDQFSWVSTHLTGPNKYSQFIYEISAKGNNASRLNFTAHHIEHKKETMSKTDIVLFADKLCKYDSNVWKLLAKAMENELSK